MVNKESSVKCIIRFMVMAFLLPLICVVLQNIIKNEIVDFILYGIQAASPSIAAIMEIRLFEKKRFDDYFVIKIDKKAIIVPLLITCITMLLSKSIYAANMGDKNIISGLSMKRWIIVLWALVAEEVGWRGFLEPTLKNVIKPPAMATFVTGIVWSLWHYHYFIQNGMDVPVLLFVAGAIVESFIYSYLLTFTNGNLLSAMIYHFSWNIFLHLFTINPSDNNGSLIPYTGVIMLEMITVFIMYVINKKKVENVQS